MSDAPIYRILIFCAKPQRLEGVARFLINRGWQVQVEKSLKKTIEVVIRYNPDLVLMTMNHPQVNPDKLYPIMQQHGARVLPFAEQSDPKTYTRLQSYPQNMVLYPPISGPGVHRKIQLIFKAEEEEQKKNERLQRNEISRTPQSGDSFENRGDSSLNVSESHQPGIVINRGSTEGTHGGIAAPSVLDQIQAKKSQNEGFGYMPAGGPITSSANSTMADMPTSSERNGDVPGDSSLGGGVEGSGFTGQSSEGKSSEGIGYMPENSGMGSGVEGSGFTGQASAGKSSEGIGYMPENSGMGSGVEGSGFTGQASTDKGSTGIGYMPQGSNGGNLKKSELSPSAPEPRRSPNSLPSDGSRGFLDPKASPAEGHLLPHESSTSGNEVEPESTTATGPMVFDEFFDAPSTEESEFDDPFADMLATPTYHSPQAHDVPDLPGRIKPSPIGQPLSTNEYGEFDSSKPDSSSPSDKANTRESMIIPPANEGRKRAFDSSGRSIQPRNSASIKEHQKDSPHSLQGAETKQHEVDREAAFGPGPSDVLKSTNDLHFVNIASATRRALEESSNFEGPVRRQARDAKYIDVYAVKNKGKQGLVVLSDQDGEGQKDKPLDNFEQRLSGHLRNSGASQGDTERIRIYVSGRSVEDLANSNGKFSFSSVNSGDEIILTYLEGEDLLPEIVEAPKDMVSVPLNSFEADKPVDFEVYLYLKQNQKFYKYLRPGRSLSGKQINKLISSNMVQLFVHKGDASLFKGHHLKNKIEGTRNSKMKKKAG